MKRKGLWAWLALAVLLAGAVAFGAAETVRANRLEARLREVYDGAVLSALRQMEDMQLSLNKALLSGDETECRQYLSAVSSGAARVQSSLALLPLPHAAAQRAAKFANQLGDYADVLLAASQMTEEDAGRLDTLIDACGQCVAALYAARDALPARALAAKEDFYAAGDGEEAFDSAVSYPTLIYDGPFSDARETGAAKGLGQREVTREEARQIVLHFVGDERVQAVADGADTGGDIPCYGFTLTLRDGLTLEAAVTRQGGKVLWLSPDSGSFSQDRSIEECREAAQSFLAARGYENMRATYFQVYEGVAVLSFAASQGETILYPDLIKVQLRMDTAEVVGVEARNYLMNHTARGALLPTLSQEEAQGAVSSRLHVTGCRLCLIPTDAGEKLCYEFSGDSRGDAYLCYINAETGKQEELLRIVEGQTGLETV